jgi:hypothetical protein
MRGMIGIIVSALSRRKKEFLLLMLVSAVGYFWRGTDEIVDNDAMLRVSLDRINRLSKNITSYGVDIVSIVLNTSWVFRCA